MPMKLRLTGLLVVLLAICLVAGETNKQEKSMNDGKQVVAERISDAEKYKQQKLHQQQLEQEIIHIQKYLNKKLE